MRPAFQTSGVSGGVLKDSLKNIRALLGIDDRWKVGVGRSIVWETPTWTQTYWPKAWTAKILSPCGHHVLRLNWLTRLLLPEMTTRYQFTRNYRKAYVEPEDVVYEKSFL
jgi:hypothetical protein